MDDSLDALIAHLDRLESLPLADWIALGAHPVLFPGWPEGHASSLFTEDRVREHPPLVQAANRLDVHGVIRALQAPDVDLNAMTPSGPHHPGHTALTAVMAILPTETNRFSSWNVPWTEAQRASQEVIVGLLLAAGARIGDLAWSDSVNALVIGVLDESDTNPRLLRRLLATGQPLPHRLSLDPGGEDQSTPSGLDDPEGRGWPTLLHRMAERCSDWPDGLVDAVIDRGVPVNARSSKGRTALHEAARSFRSFDNRGFVRSLLAAGARPDLPDDTGHWAHHLAAERDQALTLEALLDSGVPLDTPTEEIPLPTSSQVARVRFRHLTALHVAASQANTPDTMALLLERGANVDAPDAFGNTPLHLACYRNRLPAVQRLLAAGANPWARNRFERTPQGMIGLDPKGNPRHLPVDPTLPLRALFENLDLRRFTQNLPVDGASPPPRIPRRL